MAKQIKRSAESFRYVLKSDQSLQATEQTVFVLNPLSADERDRLIDEAVVTRTLPDGSKEAVDRTRQQSRGTVLAHLAGVENFPVGAPREWPKAIEDRKNYLNELADDDVLELHNELFRRSWLGDEEKNSSSPELTSRSGAP